MEKEDAYWNWWWLFESYWVHLIFLVITSPHPLQDLVYFIITVFVALRWTPSPASRAQFYSYARQRTADFEDDEGAEEMSAVSGVKLTRLLQDVSDEDEVPMTIPVNRDLKVKLDLLDDDE